MRGTFQGCHCYLVGELRFLLVGPYIVALVDFFHIHESHGSRSLGVRKIPRLTRSPVIIDKAHPWMVAVPV